MPSVSEKQRGFMGAELARKRAGKKTQTGMSEQQLRDFATKTTHTKETKPGRSVVDVEISERDPKTSTIDGATHPLHRLTGPIVWGELDPPKGSIDSEGAPQFTRGAQSCNRDIGQGVHYGATVYHHGPDTNFRAEEINPQHYGRDHEPAPYKDLMKWDKAWEAGIRRIADDMYQECETPGAVVSGAPDSSLAYGTVSFEKIDSDYEDNRTYKRQMRYERSHDEVDAELHEEDD